MSNIDLLKEPLLLVFPIGHYENDMEVDEKGNAWLGTLRLLRDKTSPSGWYVRIRSWEGVASALSYRLNIEPLMVALNSQVNGVPLRRAVLMAALVTDREWGIVA
ncbi:MAG: hypothetical protein ACRCUJ_14225 [Phocaeicola sp.]